MRLHHILPAVLFAFLVASASAFDEPLTKKDSEFKKVTILAGGETTVVEKALVRDGRLLVPAEVLPKVNGFALKPEGLCSADICIPVPKDAEWTFDVGGKKYVDASHVATHVDQSVASDKDHTVWSFGGVPRLQSSLLPAAKAPDFALKDRKGKTVRLSDFRGKKVLLLSWASW